MKGIFTIIILSMFFLTGNAQTYSSALKGSWEATQTWAGNVVPPVSNIGSEISVLHYVTRHGGLTFLNNGGKNNNKKIFVNDYLVVHGDMFFGADAIELEVGPSGKLVVFGDLTLQNKVLVANEGIVAVVGNIHVNNSVHTAYDNIDEGVTYSGSVSGADSGGQPLDSMPLSPNPIVREIYEFIMGGGGEATLPVELLYFKAREKQAGVALDWASTKEWDFSHYVVEHSQDGRNFKEIGAVEGLGESEQTNPYNFHHMNPASGLNYYRLKAVDADGKAEFKGVEVLNVLSNTDVSLEVYPNPATDGKITVLHGVGHEKAFCIRNGRGVKVFDGLLQPGQTQLNLSHLPAGLYFLQLLENAQNVGVGVRLIIQ